jgi:hypothetical protein
MHGKIVAIAAHRTRMAHAAHWAINPRLPLQPSCRQRVNPGGRLTAAGLDIREFGRGCGWPEASGLGVAPENETIGRPAEDIGRARREDKLIRPRSTSAREGRSPGRRHVRRVRVTPCRGTGDHQPRPVRRGSADARVHHAYHDPRLPNGRDDELRSGLRAAGRWSCRRKGRFDPRLADEPTPGRRCWPHAERGPR